MFSATQYLDRKFALLSTMISFLCGQYEEVPSSFPDSTLIATRLRIEVDAVGYPDKHVAIGDSVVLGYARACLEVQIFYPNIA